MEGFRWATCESNFGVWNSGQKPAETRSGLQSGSDGDWLDVADGAARHAGMYITSLQCSQATGAS